MVIRKLWKFLFDLCFFGFFGIGFFFLEFLFGVMRGWGVIVGIIRLSLVRFFMFFGILLLLFFFLSGFIILLVMLGLVFAGEFWVVFLFCDGVGRGWLLFGVGFRVKLGRIGWVGVGFEVVVVGVCCVRRVKFCIWKRGVYRSLENVGGSKVNIYWR